MIYFIQSGKDGPIKIGFVRQYYLLSNRLKQLQIGNPERLSVLAAVDGHRIDETNLHKYLSDHRIQGEWFVATPEVLAIAEMGKVPDDLPALIKARSFTVNDEFDSEDMPNDEQSGESWQYVVVNDMVLVVQ